MHPQDPKESTAEPPAQGATQDEVSSGSLGASGDQAGLRGDASNRAHRFGEILCELVECEAAGPFSDAIPAELLGRWQDATDEHIGTYGEPSSPVEAASEAPSQPQASERELPPLQGGMSNDELRTALRAKLPTGAYPEDQWLTPFALGVEVGAARAQEPDQDEPSADARDAQRWRWWRNYWPALTSMQCARFVGLDLSQTYVDSPEKMDAATDAAIGFRTFGEKIVAADDGSSGLATQSLAKFYTLVRNEALEEAALKCKEVGPKDLPARLLTEGFAGAIRSMKKEAP